MKILTRDHIVYRVTNDFLQMCGYHSDQIIGKSLEELGLLLKINSQTNLCEIKEVESIYLFTKEGVAKEVTIKREGQAKKSENLYRIEEIINTTLVDLLRNFANDTYKGEAQAIYSYPGLVCLKANKKYKNGLDLIRPEDDTLLGSLHPYPKYFSEVAKAGFYHENEAEFVSPWGIKTYWDVNLKQVHGHEGKMYLLSTIYDVTDQVIENNRIKKQKSEMKIILDNISDSINRVNKKGEYTYINKAAKERLSPYVSDISAPGYTQSEFCICNDLDGNELAFEETPVQRVLRGETLINEIIIGTSPLPTTSDISATYYQCSGGPVYDELGNIDGGVLIYKDIEDIYKINEYHAFVENMDGGFLRYASLSYDEFKIKYMNEAGMAMLKKVNPHIKENYQVIGNRFFDYFYLVAMEKEDLIKEIKKAIGEKKSYALKQWVTVDEESRYIKTIFHPKYNKNNEISTIEVVDVDITDEETANQGMNKALKMQDEMFINISHELKTPLNLISSASQLVSMYLDKDSLIEEKTKIEKMNHIIMQNCYRQTKLINNILDISKIESGLYELNLTNNDLVETINNIVNSIVAYARSCGRDIRFETKLEKLKANFDLYKFEKVLLNLISNAIKFSDAKSVILVSLDYKDEIIKIGVKDHGIGIAAEDLDIIFDKYGQANKGLSRPTEGNGIGLFLAKAITALHKGEISLESTLGKGSTFTVKLPMMALADEKIEKNQHYHQDRSEVIKVELSDVYN